MAIANNPATALERVLRTVVTSGMQTVGEGWTLALGVDPGQVEFVQRHSEVVGLLQKVHSYLNALADDEPERDVYLKYVPAWYDAVVYRSEWHSTNRPASGIIDQTVLDHLQGLGANLRRRSVGPELTDDKLADLTASLSEWKGLLGEAGLPSDLAQQIRAQVEHIEWLLANVETFGVEPVATGARTLLGLSIPVIRLGGKWTKIVAGAMTGLVLFLSPIADATEEGNRILTNLSETVHEIEHFGNPEPQKALPPGDDDAQSEGASSG